MLIILCLNEVVEAIYIRKNKILINMTRVKRGNVSRKRHKKVLKMAKGSRMKPGIHCLTN